MALAAGSRKLAALAAAKTAATRTTRLMLSEDK